MNKIFQIAIVDDHTLFREALANLINSYDKLRVVFNSSNPKDLISFLKSNSIDIVLCDIEMPEMDGFQLVTKLKQKYPDVAIIVITMHNEVEYINQMIDLEVNSYIIKDEESKNIFNAIEKIIKNPIDEDRTYFTERMAKAMQLSIRRQKRFFSLLETVDFTKKELAVIRLVCKEMTTKEIASELNISISTVNGYREKIMKKMNVKTNIGVVKYAIKYNLVDVTL